MSPSGELRIDRDADKLHRTADAELLFQSRTIIGGGLAGNVQNIGYFRHRMSNGEKARNFQFARVQAGKLAWARTGSVEGDFACHFGLEIDAALGNAPRRVDKEQRIVVLGQIALGASFDGARREKRIVVHAENRDTRLCVAQQNSAAEFQPRSEPPLGRNAQHRRGL